VAASSFEITVWVQDDRFAGAVGILAHAVAQEAGLASATCTAFADQVDSAVRASLPGLRADHELPVIVRCTGGPVEVLVGGRTITPDA
jgi:hypothetical protein